MKLLAHNLADRRNTGEDYGQLQNDFQPTMQLSVQLLVIIIFINVSSSLERQKSCSRYIHTVFVPPAAYVQGQCACTLSAPLFQCPPWCQSGASTLVTAAYSSAPLFQCPP